ncbi:hypothetical protein FJ364_01830 [Candidatus Dependentiae bacterium]|nr:hypothetical protein [Candidatus Dependentiae bacterium]
MFKKTILLLLLNWSNVLLHSEGFRGDTLVYTPCGFHPISVLSKGMHVYCYSTEGKLVLGEIIRTEKKEVYRYDQLKVGDEAMHADADQYFFCPKRNAWIKLIDFDVEQDSVLSHQQGPLHLGGRRRISTALRNIKVPIYTISVKEHQNFLITKQCILVHNYTPPKIPLSAILVNSIIDLGVNVALSCVSELVTNELAPKLKDACTRIFPLDKVNYTLAALDKDALPHVQNLNTGKNNQEVQSARSMLINKLNAQANSQNNSIMTTQQALPKNEVNKLVQELAGPSAEKSADGSYWFSIEKLANGGILTRRNHIPSKSALSGTEQEMAHFELHYSHDAMPEKTCTIVNIQIPVKD